MSRFEDETTEQIYQTRFAQDVPEHVSIAAHEAMRVLLAAGSLQDVGVSAPSCATAACRDATDFKSTGSGMSRSLGTKPSVRQLSGSDGGNWSPIVPNRFVPAPPLRPGEVLRKHFLAGLGLTQDQLAKALGVSRFSVNQIIKGRRAVTAEMALRLSHVLSTTPKLWLDLQRDVDIYEARLNISDEVKRLPILRAPKSDQELFQDVG
jgi:antitoxin HigA-1